MKKYIFGILSVAMAVGFSAFTTKKAPKPYTATIFYYTASSSHVIEEEKINQEATINTTDLVNMDNWSDEPSTTPGFASGRKLNAIAFELSADNDASINDGDLTLQQAIDAVLDRYNDTNPMDLPNNNFTFPVGTGTPTTVAVYRMN